MAAKKKSEEEEISFFTPRLERSGMQRCIPEVLSGPVNPLGASLAPCISLTPLLL